MAAIADLERRARIAPQDGLSAIERAIDIYANKGRSETA